MASPPLPCHKRQNADTKVEREEKGRTAQERTNGDRIVRRRPHAAQALTKVLVCHQGRGKPRFLSTIPRGHVQPQYPKPSLLAQAGTELLLPSKILNPQLSPFPTLRFTDCHVNSQQSFAVPVMTKKLPWSMPSLQGPRSSIPYLAGGVSPAEEQGAAESASVSCPLLFPNSITSGFPCKMYPFTNSIASWAD